MTMRIGSTTATLAFLMTSSSALAAVDADAFASRLQEAARSQGIPFEYASAEAVGDSDAILRGVKMSQTGETRDITFEDISGSTAEGWRVARVPLPDVDETTEENRVQVSEAVIEGLTVAGTTESEGAGEPAAAIFFDRASLGSLAVTAGDQEIFELSDAEIANTVSSEGGYQSAFDIARFTADFTAGNSPEAAETMRAIGYPTITGSIGGEGAWNPQSGLLSLDPLRITVEDAGEFSLAYTIDGYTPEFIASLREVEEQMEASPDNQAASMALLGLISQLTVNSARVSFEDDSLTGKLLDYYAERQGQTREELVESLTNMLPMALAMLDNPSFQEEVADAVTTYLEDPQSFTLAVTPENPVAVPQIIAAIMGAPQTLPDVLSLNVSANGNLDGDAAGDTSGGNAPSAE